MVIGARVPVARLRPRRQAGHHGAHQGIVATRYKLKIAVRTAASRLTGKGAWSTLRPPEALGRKRPVEILVFQPLVALIAGILILIIPRLLNYIVAIYLILIGLVGLFGHFGGTLTG